jgi:hypothetical protein
MPPINATFKKAERHRPDKTERLEIKEPDTE